MQRQAEVNSTVQLLGLENHWNQKGEAYMLLAKDLYSGVYREFKERSADKRSVATIKVNEEVVNTDGSKITVNDLSKLERHKVIISQSPMGVNYRETDRAINTELLRNIPGQNPISRALAVKNIMKTLPNNAEEKKEYEEAAQLEYQLAKGSAEAQIVSFEAQKIQTAMQVQQMTNPAPQPQMQQQQQTPGGSAPAVGAQTANQQPEIAPPQPIQEIPQ
jgi:hypothetical protein